MPRLHTPDRRTGRQYLRWRFTPPGTRIDQAESCVVLLRELGYTTLPIFRSRGTAESVHRRVGG